GAYEILAAIGAGGMGQVYRAHDTKLGRDVALKVLPESFAHDPDRVARFRREAQVLASLNHPHIAAIYGLEEANGSQFLVLELVEGETLTQRLKAGVLPLDEALSIARQIAEALEAAHEKGIIHRDLKPANIALTADSQVKVLDFGLAKALDPAPVADLSHSPTLTVAATQAGVILGTAAYMSPEQAKGRAADKRSDVWAFGCVLYEMLTGRRAFEGEDVSDTLAFVLTKEPDWRRLPIETPAPISKLLRRCLQKDRNERLADASDARLEIQDALTPPAADAVAAGGAPTAAVRPARLAWALVGVLAVVVVLLAVPNSRHVTEAPAPARHLARFSLPLPEGQRFTAGGRQLVAISPDGTQMVYMASQRLYLRSMSELESRVISGTESTVAPSHPVFSPDGRSVVFWNGDQTLKRIAVSGGAPVTICQADNPYGVSWSTDGILFGQGTKGIMRVSASGGKPEVLVQVKGDELAHGPQMLPGGQAVLFTLATGTGADRWDKAHVVVQSLRSGERKTLIEGGSDARYLPTGHLVYAL
ncbi:MAG: protein kinase, partial [Acidobacteria bacterium]|nr:protein kinase [Acidobacteriota bacterium]